MFVILGGLGKGDRGGDGGGVENGGERDIVDIRAEARECARTVSERFRRQRSRDQWSTP